MFQVRNVERTHANSVIGQSDADHKECENPFSPITRAPEDKNVHQAPRAPREAEVLK